MIKIYLPNIDNKFFNNLRLTNLSNIELHSRPITNIYQTHDMIHPDIYVFHANFITSEISQFIDEYKLMGCKIFIYHENDNPNKDAIRYIKNVTHIIDNETYEQYKMYNNIKILHKRMINNTIFYKTNESKLDQAVYFLDIDSKIPDDLNQYLYPNSCKYKILLFNNAKLVHSQNMGIVSEYDKAKLLNRSRYLIIDHREHYAYEGIVCGCELLSMKTLEKITLNREDDVPTFQMFLETLL